MNDGKKERDEAIKVVECKEKCIIMTKKQKGIVRGTNFKKFPQRFKQ